MAKAFTVWTVLEASCVESACPLGIVRLQSWLKVGAALLSPALETLDLVDGSVQLEHALTPR